MQRGLGQLAVETAEEEVGLKEDWEEQKEGPASIAGFVRLPAYSTQKAGHYHVPSAVQRVRRSVVVNVAVVELGLEQMNTGSSLLLQSDTAAGMWYVVWESNLHLDL